MATSSLAENLRILSGYGKSVSEICRRAKLNRTQFNRYLNGQAQPSIQTLRRLCDFFGVDEQEILQPSDTFRDLIKLRPPKIDLPDDKAAQFIQRVFLGQDKPAAQPGYYLGYLKPEPDVPLIYVNLIKIGWSGQSTTVKIVTRYRDNPINLPKRLKFEGVAFQQAGKLFCLVQESRHRRSTTLMVLSIGDFEDTTTFDGIIAGTEPEGGNEITSFRTICCFIGEKPDLRHAIRSCGSFDENADHLPPAVRMSISNSGNSQRTA